MAYRRAYSTQGCPDATLDEALAIAARHGLDGVELRVLGGTLDLPDYFARTHGTPAGLAAALRGAPAPVVVLDTSYKLAGAGPGDREKFLAFVPWAEALGIPWLRAFDGDGAPDEMAATLAWWRAQRGEHGWRTDILVETHDTLLTADAIGRLLAAAPGTAILWDSHHTWRRGGEDPLATWHAIRPHVACVHVKDSVSRPSARHSYTYVLPGEGEFPAAPLLAALRREFGGVVCLEWERIWHPYLAPVEDALAAAAERAWW